MANISRPFQIALAAVVLLAGVWLFALQGHSKSSSQGGAGSTPATSEQPSTTPSGSYHGSAPGVAGLSKDINKAKGAVSTSQQNARDLEAKSAAASSSAGSSSAASTAASGASSSHSATSHAGGSSAPATSAPSTAKTSAPGAAKTHAPATAKAPTTARSKATKPAALGTPARQKQVESSLAAGNVVVLLFWNKNGADDVADAAAVRGLARHSGKTAVMLASAKEVAAFGSVTRGVQIFGTPTILVVGKSAKATVLTGLTDAFSLQQAIAEARHA